MLANEFCLTELAAACASLTLLRDLDAEIDVQRGELQSICREVDRLKRSMESPIQVPPVPHSHPPDATRLPLVANPQPPNAGGVPPVANPQRPNPTRLLPLPRAQPPDPKPVQAPSRPPRPHPFPGNFLCAFTGPNSLDGIISSLTRQVGGNIHELGLITITSHSLMFDEGPPRYGLKNLANLSSPSWMWSKGGPSEWICWDFREVKVRPSHYTIAGQALQSWILEGSEDGTNWTHLDEQSEIRNFIEGTARTSFPIANNVDCRFIRLQQRGSTASLCLQGVEFFGLFSVV